MNINLFSCSNCIISRYFLYICYQLACSANMLSAQEGCSNGAHSVHRIDRMPILQEGLCLNVYLAPQVHHFKSFGNITSANLFLNTVQPQASAESAKNLSLKVNR